MSRASWGLLDTCKVRCWICGETSRFFPPFDTVRLARIRAQVEGWTHSSKGWACPRIHKRKSVTGAEAIQATLPGFGVLSRNAKA